MDTATATVLAAAITAIGSAITAITVAVITLRSKQYEKLQSAVAGHDASPKISGPVPPPQNERTRFIIRRAVIGFLFAYSGFISGLTVGTAAMGKAWAGPGVLAINLAISALFLALACLIKKWWPETSSPQSN